MSPSDGTSGSRSDPQQHVQSLAAEIAVRKARELELRQTMEELRASEARTEMLLRVAQSLNARQLGPDALVQQITDEATAAVGARSGAFLQNVTSPDGGGSGALREAFDRFGLPGNTTLFAATFSGEAIVRLGNVRQDTRYGQVAPHHGLPPGHPSVTSFLAVPVVSRSGTVIGGLFFEHPEADRFTEQHARLVAALASSAAVVIDNARLHRATRDAEETQRRLARERVWHGEQRMRLLVDSIRDCAIFMLDPQGQVSTWNRGAERLKGFASHEILGRHFSTFFPPDDVAAGRPEEELRRARDAETFETEGWRLRKDGTHFWANVMIGAVRDIDGTLVGYYKVTRDLTERRKLEEERVRLAQAHEMIRLRDEFLSLVSHELKTPLTGLQLQLEALQQKIDSADEKVVRKLARARLSGTRLADLIESLLDVSRIATGRFSLALAPVDLAEVVNDVVEGLRPAAEKAGCPLLARIAGPLMAPADRVRIEQLVTNLLSNAIKYGAGQPVDVTVDGVDDDLILEVRDRGPGLQPGDLSRLFDRFERAGSIRNHGGLGLGLDLVREIAAAHGGSTSAENPTGGGASFRVRLPLAGVSQAPPESAGTA
jgi:PAS domain S-box-containing protein